MNSNHISVSPVTSIRKSQTTIETSWVRTVCEACINPGRFDEAGAQHDHRDHEAGKKPLRRPVKAKSGSPHRSNNRSNCSVCNGRRYYFWDPVTLACYSPTGIRLALQNTSGETVGVVRPPEGLGFMGAVPWTTEEMLESIARWVGDDSRRDFKLWFDAGWNCSVWPNKNRPNHISSRGDNLASCVQGCYVQVRLSRA